MRKRRKNYYLMLKSMREAAWLCIVCIVVLVPMLIALCVFGGKYMATYISNKYLCYCTETVLIIVIIVFGIYAIKMHLETIKQCNEKKLDALRKGILKRMREYYEEESIDSEEHDEWSY